MAQAKKKTATKTSKKAAPASCKKKACEKSCAKKGARCEKYKCTQHSSPFFLITMSMLAATLLFADIFMMMS